MLELFSFISISKILFLINSVEVVQKLPADLSAFYRIHKSITLCVLIKILWNSYCKKLFKSLQDVVWLFYVDSLNIIAVKKECSSWLDISVKVADL